MKHSSISSFLSSMFACLLPCSLLMAAPPVILEDAKDVYPLGRHIEYLEDRTGALRIEDVSSSEFDAQFMASQKDVLNFGMTRSVYWVRFQLQGPVRDQDTWLLVIQSVNWNLAQCYVPTDDHPWLIQEGGRRLPFDRTIFINNNTVFRLPQPIRNDHTIYLRLEASIPEMYLNVQLRSANAHQEAIEREILVRGMFYGVLIIVAVYNLFLYFSIRDKSYLFYTSYLSGLIAFFMIDNRVGVQWYWQIPNSVISRIEVFLFCVFEICFILFVKSFLQTKHNTPNMDKALSCSMGFSIGAVVVFFVLGIESNIVPILMIASILLMIVTVLTVGILCVKQGYTPARYFLLASTTFVGAMALGALQALEVLPGYDPGMHFMKAGVVLEAMLYSLALANRLKYERRLTEELQQQVLEAQTRMTQAVEQFAPKQFLQGEQSLSTVILTTKLYLPPLQPHVVLRPRLIERLNEGLRGKLTLISAPAGFGKTTLISEWVAGGERPAAWLALDEDDSEFTRFLAYLVAALQTLAMNPVPSPVLSKVEGGGEGIEANIGKRVLDVLLSPQHPPTESLLTILLNDIAAIPDNFTLVLDDYHVIDSRPVDHALIFLIEHLPPQMHLIIATREDPRFPLARLRVKGQLTELRSADLRFTPSEAADFLNEVMSLNLSEEDIIALENRTEGWIAGLQLAAISMKGQKDASSLMASFTGSHRFVLDYLIEEVLEQQSERVQTFLLRTSILDRLCGPLCDAVCSDPEKLTPRPPLLGREGAGG